MNCQSRVFVAGGNSLVGSALLQLLHECGFSKLVGVGADEPPLSESWPLEAFFRDERPEYVFLVGGKSGGIGLNRERPAELMIDNLRVIANVIDAAHRHGVWKLLYLASGCGYPKNAPQPLRIESLLTGALEPTSEAYAMAKLAGWKLCEAYRKQYGCRFITAIGANAFGPHDDFGPESGHVIPALIQRAHRAKIENAPVLQIWGTGTPRREFIFSRDLADACLFTMRHYDDNRPINLGGGEVLSIASVAQTVADVVGFRGRLEFDLDKPDGAPLKALDATRLASLGWQPATEFRSAVAKTYHWFLHHGVTEDSQHVSTTL